MPYYFYADNTLHVNIEGVHRIHNFEVINDVITIYRDDGSIFEEWVISPDKNEITHTSGIIYQRFSDFPPPKRQPVPGFGPESTSINGVYEGQEIFTTRYFFTYDNKYQIRSISNTSGTYTLDTYTITLYTSNGRVYQTLTISEDGWVIRRGTTTLVRIGGVIETRE
jgi:hypothetical protein